MDTIITPSGETHRVTCSRYATAKSFVDHAEKLMRIVHGDDGLLWVVTPREAEQLARQWYEIVA
jgi:hypothetical protein